MSLGAFQPREELAEVVDGVADFGFAEGEGFGFGGAGFEEGASAAELGEVFLGEVAGHWGHVVEERVDDGVEVGAVGLQARAGRGEVGGFVAEVVADGRGRFFMLSGPR